MFILLESESPKLRLIFGQNPKFERFFRPKTDGLQKKKKKKKKKKRSSPKFRLIFRPESEISTLYGTYSRHVQIHGAPPVPPWLRYWSLHALSEMLRYAIVMNECQYS